jgi:hypothetical protein
LAKHRYASDKRQKEIKRQKRQQEKKLRKEQQGTPEAEQDEKALIREYLGIDPETPPDSDQSTP